MDTDMAVFRHGLFAMLREFDHRDPLWITSAICCRAGRGCHRLVCPKCPAKGGPPAGGLPCDGACTPQDICRKLAPGDTENCLRDSWPVAYGGTGGASSCRRSAAREALPGAASTQRLARQGQ
jgi:hypothetical protein